MGLLGTDLADASVFIMRPATFVSEADELERLNSAVTACTEFLVQGGQLSRPPGKGLRHTRDLPGRALQAASVAASAAFDASCASSAADSPSPSSDSSSGETASASGSTGSRSGPCSNTSSATSVALSTSGNVDESTPIASKGSSPLDEAELDAAEDEGEAEEPLVLNVRHFARASRAKSIQTHVPGLIAASSPSLRRKWLSLYARTSSAPPAGGKADSGSDAVGPLEVGWFTRQTYDTFCHYAQTHQRLSWGLDAQLRPAMQEHSRENDDDDLDSKALVLYWGEWADGFHECLLKSLRESIIGSISNSAAQGGTAKPRSELFRLAGSTPRDILTEDACGLSKSPDEQFLDCEGGIVQSVLEVALRAQTAEQLLRAVSTWRFETNAIGLKVIEGKDGQVELVLFVAEARPTHAPIRAWTWGETAAACATELARDSAEPLEVQSGHIAGVDARWFACDELPPSASSSVPLDLRALAHFAQERHWQSSGCLGLAEGVADRPSLGRKRFNEESGATPCDMDAQYDSSDSARRQPVASGGCAALRRKPNKGSYLKVDAAQRERAHSASSSEEADQSDAWSSNECSSSQRAPSPSLAPEGASDTREHPQGCTLEEARRRLQRLKVPGASPERVGGGSAEEQPQS